MQHKKDTLNVTINIPIVDFLYAIPDKQKRSLARFLSGNRKFTFDYCNLIKSGISKTIFDNLFLYLIIQDALPKIIDDQIAAISNGPTYCVSKETGDFSKLSYGHVYPETALQVNDIIQSVKHITQND